jgi:phenylalanyl-tRNA synthetase alpha chain
VQSFADILLEWKRQINEARSFQDLERVKVSALGKTGVLTLEFRRLASLSGDEKKKAGAVLNVVKTELEEILRSKTKELEASVISERLANEALDVTLPVIDRATGKRHIISDTILLLRTYFSSIGFDVVDGPEIEDDFHNFSALNMPAQHPARQSQDSFYIAGFQERLLRTHTSGVQVRYMTENPLPVRMVSLGRVFRNDAIDATHSPVFHQIEGLVVDEKPISIGVLKQTLADFLAFFFDDPNPQIRFRPSFFPFTEPGMEVDYKHKKGGQSTWLEIAGSGMVHPNVYRACEVKDDAYGFAFGIGIDRLIMIRNEIFDIRSIFSTDLRWLSV